MKLPAAPAAINARWRFSALRYRVLTPRRNSGHAGPVKARLNFETQLREKRPRQ